MVYSAPVFKSKSRSHMSRAKRNDKLATSAWADTHPYIYTLVKKDPVDPDLQAGEILYTRAYISLYTVFGAGTYKCCNPPPDLIEFGAPEEEEAT